MSALNFRLNYEPIEFYTISRKKSGIFYGYIGVVQRFYLFQHLHDENYYQQQPENFFQILVL